MDGRVIIAVGLLGQMVPIAYTAFKTAEKREADPAFFQTYSAGSTSFNFDCKYGGCEGGGKERFGQIEALPQLPPHYGNGQGKREASPDCSIHQCYEGKREASPGYGGYGNGKREASPNYSRYGRREALPDYEGKREASPGYGGYGNGKREASPGYGGYENGKREASPDYEGKREASPGYGGYGNGKREASPDYEGKREASSSYGGYGNGKREASPDYSRYGKREASPDYSRYGKREASPDCSIHQCYGSRRGKREASSDVKFTQMFNDAATFQNIDCNTSSGCKVVGSNAPSPVGNSPATGLPQRVISPPRIVEASLPTEVDNPTRKEVTNQQTSSISRPTVTNLPQPASDECKCDLSQMVVFVGYDNYKCSSISTSKDGSVCFYKNSSDEDAACKCG